MGHTLQGLEWGEYSFPKPRPRFLIPQANILWEGICRLHISLNQLGLNLDLGVGLLLHSHITESGQVDFVIQLIGKIEEAVSVNSWGPITPMVSRGPDGDRVLQYVSGLDLCHSICCPAQKAGARESPRKLELGSIFQRDANPLPAPHFPSRCM